MALKSQYVRFYALLILILITTACVSQNIHECTKTWTATGTTPHIRDQFIGKCWEYQTALNPPVNRTTNSFKNCTELWKLFFDAFGYKDACNVSKSDYAPFVSAATEILPKDKVIFWEGTYTLVHDYSARRRRFVPIAETLLGYMVNNLAWCGSKQDPGFNCSYCPSSASLTCGEKQMEYAESFWAPASVAYAKQAAGTAHLLLNGTRSDGRPSHDVNSFFSKYELPNLQKETISQILIMVAHDIDVPHRETCLNGSLPELQAEIKKKDITYSCTDDPLEIRHLLCVDNTESKECLFASSLIPQIIVTEIPVINGATKQPLFILILVVLTSAIFCSIC